MSTKKWRTAVIAGLFLAGSWIPAGKASAEPAKPARDAESAEPAKDAKATPAKKGSSVAMELRSAAFVNDGTIPKRHTCSGDDVSPPLAWKGLPAGTKSLALIMEDPDAPAGTWVHWVLYDIPAGAKGLPEGLARDETLPDGSAHGACWGVEEFARVGWQGPCPPAGKVHRYVFTLYALKERLGLPPKAAKASVLKAMKGRILAEARLTGRFRR